MTEPITLQQLKDASTDADTFAEFLNSSDAKNLTSRLLTVYPTLIKAIQSIGFTGSNAWLTATAYSDFQVLITEAGNTYTLAIPHTSGVFATDLAAGKWVLYNPGGLGSAAFATLTADIADDAANKVLQTADFGVGANASTRGPQFVGDLDSIDYSGTIYASTGATNAPPGAVLSGIVLTEVQTSARTVQLYLDTALQIFYRTKNTAWSGWDSVWTSGTLNQEATGGLRVRQWMRNMTGGNIGDSGIVAGSSLDFAKANTSGVVVAVGASPTGSWKNVTGATLADNEFGEFVRTV